MHHIQAPRSLAASFGLATLLLAVSAAAEPDPPSAPTEVETQPVEPPQAAPTEPVPPPVAPPPSAPPLATAVPPGHGPATVLPPARSPEPPAPRKGSPPARVGFQFKLNTGLALPMGRATGDPGDTLEARYSPQFFAGLVLGAKATDAWFVGAYGMAAIGAEGTDARVEYQCRDREQNLHNDIACGASSLHVGVLTEYGFLPDDAFNPWVGFGIGYEEQTQSIADHVTPRSERTTASGLAFPLYFGGDWRIGRVVGLGLYLGLQNGVFLRTTTQVDDAVTHRGSVTNRAFHSWFTTGLRMVFFP